MAPGGGAGRLAEEMAEPATGATMRKAGVRFRTGRPG